VVAGDRTSRVERWDGAAGDAPARPTLCWRVPYGSLVPRDLDNVLAAGRCVGAEHDSAGALRVMINALQFGQAAGAAAAMSVGTAGVRSFDVKELRRCLVDDGVPLINA
jgi:hypothetical protein